MKAPVDMELSTREDIEAPIAFVFGQVTDFAAFERQAMRRGADVRRRDTRARPGTGSGWDVVFKFRGKDRDLTAEVTEFDAPNLMHLTTRSGGIDGVTVIELVPLAPGRTRMSTQTTLTASGLSARLLLQSLKLAKGTLAKRLSGRLSSFARDVEGRFTRQG